MLNGEDTGKSQNINAENEWKYSFKDLDKYNPANIDENKYDVEEVKIDGFIVVKDGYNLTNIQTTNISGTKIWKDDNNPNRPDSVTVQLLANSEKLEGKTTKVTKANQWKYNFNKLPKYDKDGNKIIYTIEEEKVAG